MQKWPVISEKHIKQSHNVLFIFELYWTMNAKSLKKLLVINEIWFWLPPSSRTIWPYKPIIFLKFTITSATKKSNIFSDSITVWGLKWNVQNIYSATAILNTKKLPQFAHNGHFVTILWPLHPYLCTDA